MPDTNQYELYDCLLEGVQVVDVHGRYIYVNDTAARHGKRTRNELIGSTLQNEYPGIELTDLYYKIQQCYAEKRSMELINEFNFSDGSEGYFKLRLQPVEDGVLILSFDISEFKVHEAKINKKNIELQHVLREPTDETNRQKQDIEAQKARTSTILSLHKAILDNTTDSIVLISPQHQVLCFNKEIRNELLKYFRNSIRVGDDYRDFVFESARDMYMVSFLRAMNGATIVVEDETVQGDEAIRFQYKVNPVYDELGLILGVALTATNTDTRKIKEIALKESEDKVRLQAEKIRSSEKYYRTLIETGSDAIVLLDADGKVLYQTPSTENILGYCLAEIQAIDTTVLIHPDEREQDSRQFLELVSSPGKIVKQRHRVKHKNGNYIWIDGTYKNMLGDPDVQGVVLNYTNVTDKVLFEESLKKINRELSVLNEINDIIIRNHDEFALFADVCDCIVNSGGYQLAWVCLKPGDANQDKTVKPLTASGEIAYLKDIKISLDDPILSKGPTATALQTGKTVITNNVSASPTYQPWLEKARKYGISASIVLPLNFNDGTYGAINIYSGETEAFDGHEAGILDRVAKNLSLAAQNIRSEKERRKTKYLLRERVKELTTIYKVNKVLQNQHLPIDTLFSDIVRILPGGWQYPDICAAKIIFNDQVYQTPNYISAPVSQVAHFNLIDGSTGLIEVVYTKDLPPHDGEPFFKEEWEMINTLAETIQVYCNKVSQQKAVAQSEAYFRSSFEYAAVGKALTSLNGKYFRVNKSFCDMLGYSQDEMLALSFAQITYNDDIDRDMFNTRLLLDGAKEYYRVEKRYVHKNGSIVWGNLNTAVVRDAGGNPIHFVSQIENITERKKSEDALIKSEANMKTIFNNTDVGYLLIDQRYNVVSFNDQFKNSFETEAGALLKLNSHLFDVVPAGRKERMRAIFDKIISDLKPVEYEYKFSFGNTAQYLYVKIIPVVSGTQTIGICLSATDITGRKKLELERQTMIDDLLQRNSDLQQFAHIVSHNVRGPLATILGLNSLFEDDISQEELKFLLVGIKTSSEKLDIVIRDLNQILQVKRELSETKVFVNLDEIVSEISESISLLIKDSQAVIDCNFAAAGRLLTVRSYISSIFYNLITNSIKYSKLAIPPVIKIWTQLRDKKLIISIQDNGIGIDLKKNKEKMFMLYQRFNFEVEGKGMGLFITKTQVEVLNGKIEVESELGTGTTFHLIFPQ